MGIVSLVIGQGDVESRYQVKLNRLAGCISQFNLAELYIVFRTDPNRHGGLQVCRFSQKTNAICVENALVAGIWIGRGMLRQ